MFKYADIADDLTIAGFRVFDEAPVIATHKTRSDGGPLLRPVVENDVPPINAAIETVATEIVVSQNQVTITNSAVRRSVPDQIMAVKAEAQRRIYAIYPQWKQANMTARAVELVRKGETNWTAEEQSEAAALDAAWAWIKSVRVASGAIEEMNQIPADYAADGYWP